MRIHDTRLARIRPFVGPRGLKSGDFSYGVECNRDGCTTQESKMPEKLKVAIVGAAGRGGGFFKTFNICPHTTVHALCDIDQEKLDKKAKELGIALAFTDYEQMLDRAKPDIVVIGTPMPFHAPQAIAALERNVSVLSEVPAAVSIEQCYELVKAARKSKARYMMAENYCYMRPNVLVRELVRAGLFGEPYFGEGEYIHELKGLNEITKWRRRWQTGINGCTYPTHSLGPHIQWFEQRVVAVSCFGSGHHYRDPRGNLYENEDTTTMACRMEKGGLVQVRLDMLSDRPHNLTYYSLQGTDGCYEAPRGLGDEPKIWLRAVHGKDMKWRPLRELEEKHLPKHWLNPPEEAVKAGHGGGDYWEVMDFASAIIEGRDPPIDLHRALDMTLPGLVSQQSILEGGRWLAVPDSRTW
ncbi:MAG: Gfo/Idh/MocA family oxidoreductase [Planctomycetes bacterium]|nr:Gfo/Idh/MocA family oxidoreductase [Planctomycetota bacterium]